MAKKSGLLLAVLLLIGVSKPAHAGQDQFEIGVLTDLSGPYATITGSGSVAAAQMAIDEFGGKVLGKPIKLISADHQNKPDIGVNIARSWFDTENVHAIFDVTNSAVALAVAFLAKERNRVVAFSGASTAELTGKACSETTTQWAYDTYSLVNGTVKPLVKQGDSTWYFIALDAAGGRAIEQAATRSILAAGGKVLGSVHHPLNTPDFSSFLLQAQASGAKVVALANAGADLVNTIKQAREFGLTKNGTKLVGTFFLINDVHALGLQAAQGSVLTEDYYWDLDDASRAWDKRFRAIHGAPANMLQAGVYDAVFHYLKAVKKAGTDDGKTVSAIMKELPVNDDLLKNVKIRSDGRVMRDVYTFQVKTPSESKGPWDYYRHIGTVKANDAYLPLSESECPLVHK